MNVNMRILPSDIVRQIKRFFPAIEGATPLQLSVPGHGAELETILKMLDQLPTELLVLSPDDFAALETALATIRSELDTSRSHGERNLRPTPGYQSVSPVKLIYNLLLNCPDETAATSSCGFEFIDGEPTRKALQIDRAEADKVLADGAWKAATVLAGSLVEALLFWALARKESHAIETAIAGLRQGRFALPRADRNLDEWSLHEYVEVSAALAIIREKTAAQVRLAKEFRNLIHPGLEQRRATKCGRGEALGAIAAVELVLRDLAG